GRIRLGPEELAIRLVPAGHVDLAELRVGDEVRPQVDDVTQRQAQLEELVLDPQQDSRRLDLRVSEALPRARLGAVVEDRRDGAARPDDGATRRKHDAPRDRGLWAQAVVVHAVR